MSSFGNLSCILKTIICFELHVYSKARVCHSYYVTDNPNLFCRSNFWYEDAVRRALLCGECSKIKKPLAGSKSIDAQDALDFRVFVCGGQGDGVEPQCVFIPIRRCIFQVDTNDICSALYRFWEHLWAGGRHVEQAAPRNYGIHTHVFYPCRKSDLVLRPLIEAWLENLYM